MMSSLGLKVTPAIKDRLDAEAHGNGRTQSQEAEVRLENSFREDREFATVLRQITRQLSELISVMTMIADRMR